MYKSKVIIILKRIPDGILFFIQMYCMTIQYLSMQTNTNILTGTVIAVYPSKYTCDVVLTSGGILYDVGIMNAYGGILSNDVGLLPNLKGAAVAMLEIYGKKYVLGTLPVQVRPKANISLSTTNTGTGGDNEQTYGKQGGSTTDFSGARTKGFQPGDKLIRTDGTAEMSLCGDGLAMLKASPMAQFILGSCMDFARLIAREFKIFTDFGELEMSHGGSGKVRMSIKGGAQFCDESSPSGGAWTVQMYLGDVPENPEARLAIHVNDIGNSEHVHCTMGADGNLFLETTKNEDRIIGQDQNTSIMRDRACTILGDDTLTISGARVTAITDTEDHIVKSDRTVTTSASETHNVSDSMTLTAGSLTVNAGSISVSSCSGGSGPCEIVCNSFNIVKG